VIGLPSIVSLRSRNFGVGAGAGGFSELRPQRPRSEARRR